MKIPSLKKMRELRMLSMLAYESDDPAFVGMLYNACEDLELIEESFERIYMPDTLRGWLPIVVGTIWEPDSPRHRQGGVMIRGFAHNPFSREGEEGRFYVGLVSLVTKRCTWAKRTFFRDHYMPDAESAAWLREQNSYGMLNFKMDSRYLVIPGIPWR